MKKILFAASMIVALSSQNVFARGGGQSFSEIDGNSDGRVSLEEFMKKPAEHFKRIDTNQDGFIQPEEMEAMREARRERRR